MNKKNIGCEEKTETRSDNEKLSTKKTLSNLNMI